MKQINANKPHIAIFGKCNSGKSTLMNFLSMEDISIVAPNYGTTTDSVKRSIEIENFAPVVIYDTAGIDDTTDLGVLRVQKSFEIIDLVDLAIVVLSHNNISEHECYLINRISERGVTLLLLHNNFDQFIMTSEFKSAIKSKFNSDVFGFSPLISSDKNRLLELIKLTLPKWSYVIASMIPKSIEKGDIVMLITPIDISAPAGRLILPQVQAIRNLLDINAIIITVQLSEILTTLKKGIIPKLVITDSQFIKEVTDIFTDINTDITTFSILLASSKGDINLYKEGLNFVDSLKLNDKVLVIENCIHQTSCEDIGRVKIPNWLEEYLSTKLNFTFVSGSNPLPERLSDYALVLQCGGCMVTRRQLHNKISRIKNAGVPITNYGLLIRKIRQS